MRIRPLKKVYFAILVGLVFSIIISSVSVFADTCDDIRHDVLRLHILANSDTQADQQLKLAVRDEILSMDNQLFSEATNLASAKTIAACKIDEIKGAAEREIKAHGYNYNVSIELKNMYFSTREYDNFTLPAGKYDALRITIGEGKGKNWWCVLYPPLCIPASSKKAEIDDVLTGAQTEIVENKSKYKFEFAAVEIYEKLKNMFIK